LSLGAASRCLVVFGALSRRRRLAVAYLATVTKNSNAVNDLSEKFMLVHAHARGAKGLV
jgi:hypothetical protein